MHYNRRQNKGWDGVSQIKKLDSYPTTKKWGVMCLYLGKRDMRFRKQKREWFVATRLGSMQLGERLHFCPSKNVGGYSNSTLGRPYWTIAGRVMTMLIMKRDLHVRDCKKGVRGGSRFWEWEFRALVEESGEGGGLSPLPGRSCD